MKVEFVPTNPDATAIAGRAVLNKTNVTHAEWHPGRSLPAYANIQANYFVLSLNLIFSISFLIDPSG